MQELKERAAYWLPTTTAVPQCDTVDVRSALCKLVTKNMLLVTEKPKR